MSRSPGRLRSPGEAPRQARPRTPGDPDAQVFGAQARSLPLLTRILGLPRLRGMTIHRMDHVGIVVEDLAAAIAFFVELGLELEGEAAVEGEWVDQLVGLDGVRADLAFVRTPDGHGRVELSTFHTPAATSTAPRAPMNVPGIPRLTFSVGSVDDVLERLRPHGAELVGEVAQYEDIYRYVYVRGPAGVIIGLVEELG